MPDHIHGDHDYSPNCCICLAGQHTAYEAEQAKDAAKDAALLATSSGPVLFWGCLLAAAAVVVGLLIPTAILLLS